MGLPAARVGDLHNCPMFTGPAPHVGGPVMPPGAVKVLIGGQPAARMGDQALCAAGPPDIIMKAEPTVLIGGKPAARQSDQTAHGGIISVGCPTVLIGGPAAAGVSDASGGTVSRCPGVDAKTADAGIDAALAEQKQVIQDRKAELTRWNSADQGRFQKWFGTIAPAARASIATALDRMAKVNASASKNNFFPAAPANQAPGQLAYVYPSMNDKIFLDSAFCQSPVKGANSKTDTLCHEMSHYKSVAGTADVPLSAINPAAGPNDAVYGISNSQQLAQMNPNLALQNADNFAYFCAGI